MSPEKTFMDETRNKKIAIVIFAFVLALGAFLRAYNFAPWLHFELDQSRDAMVVDLALDGDAADLPLLGPKAAGTFLRLGPAFYYMQYLGGLVFGKTPAGLAYPFLILSVLTLPLAYLVLRRVFSRNLALGAMAALSVSAFAVMYGRFAWNPNPIPFFVLLTFYGLLRAVDSQGRHKGKYLVLAAFSLAIATQLHFLVFLALPAVAALFLLIKRPKLGIWVWLAAVLAIVLCYSPVILNDIRTGGASIGQFKEAVSKKSDTEKNEAHSLPEKMVRAYSEASGAVLLMLSGYESIEIPSVDLGAPDGSLVDVRCDAKCRDDIGWGILAILVFSGGLVLWMFKFALEREKTHRDVLLLLGIWTISTLALYVPLSYNLSPRFFLLLVPAFLVIFALSAEFFGKLTKKPLWILYAFLFLVAAGNLVSLYGRFDELRRSSFQAVEDGPDRILKEKARVTLAQQLAIAEELEKAYRENGAIVYLNSEPHYRRAVLYHLRRRGVPYEDFRNAKVYRKGNYFVLYLTNGSYDAKVAKYAENYEEIERKNFGTLTLSRFLPIPEKIVAEEQVIEPAPAKKKSAPGVPERYTWREALSGLGGSAEETDEEEDVL